MAVRVVALIKAQDGQQQAVGDELRKLAEASRGEDGCLSYELFVSSADPLTFATVELWDSQAALEAHNSGPHPAAASQAAGHLLAAPPEIHPITPF